MNNPYSDLDGALLSDKEFAALSDTFRTGRTSNESLSMLDTRVQYETLKKSIDGYKSDQAAKDQKIAELETALKAAKEAKPNA